MLTYLAAFDSIRWGLDLKKLFLIGGGGHCHSCIDVIESSEMYQIEGIFDNNKEIGRKILGYKVVGRDEDIPKFVSDDTYFLITLGQIKSSEIRKKTFHFVKANNGKFATIVSKRAYVSKYAKIGEGTIVMHDVLVNANAIVNEHVILNTKSVVEHDVIIESFCHISTGAIVNGNCKIENGSFVGSLATIEQGKTVGNGVLVKAGSFFRG